MAGKVSKNNVLAGLFVVAAMILAVAMSVVVSGAQKRLAATKSYTIRFALADGASGIKIDSPVTLGGQEVGRVIGIKFDKGDSDAIKAVDVKVAVRSSLVLHKDAWAFLEKPLLGSMSSINFSRLGEEGPALDEDAMLLGVLAPPGFLAQAGYGPDQIQQVKRMIAEASEATTKINRIADRLDKEVDPNLKSIRQSLDDLTAVTAEWRAKSPQWTARVDSVLAKADEAASEFKPIAQQAKTVVSDADQAIKDFRAMLEENRAPLNRAVTNAEEGMAHFKNDTLAYMDDTFKTSKQAAENMRDSTERFQSMVKEEVPNIQRMLANFRLASDQIKLVGIEVRRNPWRLLYSPKTKELDSELFYDAARTYAEAVGDLRAASEALRALSAGPNPASHETIDHIKARLEEAFKKYQDAEKDLLKKMTEK